MIFLIIAIITLALISNKIYKILKNYKKQVIENEKELKVLNKSLEEMISNIAHQWRQPLTELSSILMFIKLKFDTKTLDSKIMENKIEDATQVLEYMSHTIDDFRGFFSPKKEKERFYLHELIENILLISSNMFKNNNIEIVCDIDKNIVLNSYLNELQQVILNILKNAKDALVENNIKSPYIKIEAKVDEKNIYLSITDNAGGIKTEPINKIFEAYFTTKPQGQGTGIGLYMSKMILEKSMKGKLFVENIEDKARFTIKL